MVSRDTGLHASWHEVFHKQRARSLPGSSSSPSNVVTGASRQFGPRRYIYIIYTRYIYIYIPSAGRWFEQPSGISVYPGACLAETGGAIDVEVDTDLDVDVDCKDGVELTLMSMLILRLMLMLTFLFILMLMIASMV